LTAAGAVDQLGYALAYSTNTLSVTQASLIVSGLTASNKTYDTTTSATLGGTAAITALTGDTVTLGGAAVGTFADKNAGTGKAVTVTGNTISGIDAANYALVQQNGLIADINAAPVMNDISDFIDSNMAVLSTPAIYVFVTQEPTKAVFKPVDFKLANAVLVDGTIGSSGVGSGAVISNAESGFSGFNFPTALPLEPLPANNLAPLPKASVQVLRAPSASEDGLVEVFVPKDALSSNAGFAFALPTSILANTTAATASSADGKALPDWLKFDPVLNTFTASLASEGDFPLKVVLTNNGVRTTILISALP
jgi:hypothetical protein